MNHADIIHQACADMTGHAPPLHAILSKVGKFVRFSTNGKPDDKSGSLKVWSAGNHYVFVVKDHRTGLTRKGTTQSKENQQLLTPAERYQLRMQRAEMERKAQARAQRKRRMLAGMAKRLWATASKPESWTTLHPYIKKKGIQPLNVRRFTSHKRDVLVLPMVNVITGKIESLYLIYANGFKRPLKGTQFSGLCMAVGGELRSSPVLWLAEGWATAISLHMEVKQPVVVAFSAGNLEPVAQRLRERFPTACIKLCADDDRATQQRTGKNAGIDYAKRLQQRYPEIALYKPIFPTDAPEGLSDVNDLVNWQRKHGGGK